MPALQQYVLEPMSTGDYDEGTIADVFEVLETVLSSVSDKANFPAVVKIKMNERFGDGVNTGVAGLGTDGKNLWIRISGVRGANDVEVGGRWHKKKEENLGNRERFIQTLPYNFVMTIMAKIRGVRSLQDLAAYQVACSPGTNLEKLPKLIKKVVSKFKFELPKTKSKYMIIL
eukprot:GFUD01133729.1.p1 GENE.GFUD01133729.1~~GFUD01133729.1.p1  ORF type:complete len:173 (-),score=38.09 GFUD01133729.1:27-545(-)